MITYKCPKCEQNVEVDVTPITLAQLCGPPENCYPEEGGEIEPDVCPCGEKIDAGECHRLDTRQHQDNEVDSYLAEQESYGDDV